MRMRDQWLLTQDLQPSSFPGKPYPSRPRRRKSFRLPCRFGHREGEDMAPGKDRPAMPTGAGRLRVVGFAAAFFAVALVAACSSSNSGGTTTTNPDDGTQLTLWVRS